MERVNLADAKAHLSELVTRASQGEEIQIVRRGKLVALLTAPEKRKLEPFDWDALERFTDTLPAQKEGAGEFMRRLRDGERY